MLLCALGRDKFSYFLKDLDISPGAPARPGAKLPRTAPRRKRIRRHASGNDEILRCRNTAGRDLSHHPTLARETQLSPTLA